MDEVPITPLKTINAVDAADLAELVRQLSSTAQPVTIQQLQSLCEHDAITLLVARREGRIVGMLTLACFPTPTGLRAWIEDVVTSEAVRGAGVGAGLVNTALELARTNGARTVDLTSRPSREAANRLYLRLGFKPRESNLYRYTLD